MARPTFPRPRSLGILVASALLCLGSIAWVAPTESAPLLPPLLTTQQREQLQERDRLRGEVKKLRAAGKLPEAVAAAEKVVAIEREVFGADHEKVAASLALLAEVHEEREDYPAARRARTEALQFQAKRHGDQNWRVTDARLALAHTDQLARLTAAQRKELKRVPALNKEFAQLYHEGKYQQAIEPAQTALRIRREVLGNDHPAVAVSLNYLGVLFRDQGDYLRARRSHEEASEIRKKALGADHPATLVSLNNLGLALQDQGDYAGARVLFERVLPVRKQTLGPDCAETAQSLNSLAVLLSDKGDYAAARPYYEEALATFMKVAGPEHPATAMSLHNLGLLLQKQGDFEGARSHCERALAVLRRTLGPEHPDTATTLNALGDLLRVQGDYAPARSYLEEALLIQQKVFGQGDAVTAGTLNNLGLLLLGQGDRVGARKYLEDSLRIFRKEFRPEHPLTANSLDNLAVLARVEGDYAGTRRYLEEALAITARNLRLAADGQSQRQQLAMMRSLRHQLDHYLTLAADTPLPASATYAHVLTWKGAVFAHEQRLRQTQGHPELRSLFTELQTTSGRLARLALDIPAPHQRDAWRSQLADGTRQRERLERELSSRSVAFAGLQKGERLTPSQLGAALPPGTVLVDFLEYEKYTPPPDGKWPWIGQPHLAAFIIAPKQPVVSLDLGPIQAVQEAVDAWRKDFGRSQPGINHEAGTRLRRLVWHPLEAHLTDAKVVLISPDGALCGLPFAALPGKQPGTYLLEERAVAVVPVPQLLPTLLTQPSADPAAPPSLLVVGDVDYQTAGAEPRPDARAAPRAATRDGILNHWSPLPGTAAEIAAIKRRFERTFPQGTVHERSEDQATVAAVREQAPRHRFVHIATHGFFAPPELKSALARSKAEQALPGDLFGNQDVGGWHPGLLSGLVLAGANRRAEPGQDDGILTALEVAAMDLSGVELATLSACETGLGEAAGGEGLLGLQRAFQTAGARSVVASLWKVSDRDTRLLMADFYDNLWKKKLSKVEALRQAQLAMLRGELRGLEPAEGAAKADRRRPPYYWAGFVLSGDWR